MKRLFEMLGSRILAIWMITMGIVYYLTVAVWAKEAFASLVENLRSNPLFILPAVLLFANITVRGIKAMLRVRRNRRIMFLRLPLIAGLILFLFASFMSNAFRQGQWKVVGVNDVLEYGEGKEFRVTRIDPAIKNEVISIEGDGGIFSYEPSLVLMDRDGVRYEVGAYPPTRVKGLYMHVLQFGLAPGIEFLERQAVIAKGYMIMRLLPFGGTDGFEIPPYPYRFNLSIRPDRMIRKGSETAYHYDIERPLYNVVITKGDKLVSESETDTGLSFDGQMRLNFFKPDFWIMLETVKDPFLALFVGSGALLVLGIVLYPFSFLVRETGPIPSVVEHVNL